MVYNLFGGCSWYALIVYPADVHYVSQLIGPCTSFDNAFSCCDRTTVCGDGFHTVIYMMILVPKQESKKPEGRRRQNFLVVRRVARAFRLAVEAAICFWLLHSVLWYPMLVACCPYRVRRFRNRLCTAY